MSKYIDNSACPQCDDYIKPYGCTNNECPIYKDWEEKERENNEE